MGCWMTYQRFRHRNRAAADMSVLDLDRMERDYLNPAYPVAPYATRPAGSSPSEEAARALGMTVEDVRRVLGYVFHEQL